MLRASICVLVIVTASVLDARTIQDSEKHVFLTALDKDGTPLTGLTTEHLAVRESGRDRAVIRVEPVRTPMHIAVIVDTSIANGAPDETFRSTVVQFVEGLAASNHVALYSCGDRATRLADFTKDAAQLRTVAAGMFGWSHQRSHLIDAIELSLGDFARAESPRPVMLVISSESPEASRRTAGGVIKRLISQSVAFHAISLTGAVRSLQHNSVTADVPSSSQRLSGMISAGEGDRERTQMLEQGTSVTGGGRQRLASTLALAPALARVVNELSNSYKVTFARPGSSKLQNLQVGIIAEGVTLRVTAAAAGGR